MTGHLGIATQISPTEKNGTAMVRLVSTDLFDTDAEAIVNSVNCVGVMGKGVAEGVKIRWPVIYRQYRQDCGVGLACDGTYDRRYGPTLDQLPPPCCAPGCVCTVHRVAPGKLIARPTRGQGVQWVIDMPTKRHWKNPSRLEDVRASIEALPALLAATGIRSVAIPPPGCGNGGLDWERQVGPIVEAVLGQSPVDVRVHLRRP